MWLRFVQLLFQTFLKYHQKQLLFHFFSNYLKIKAIFAISFARIHRSNLINNGILPLVINQKDYDFFNDQDEYELINLLDSVENNKDITVINKTNNQTITAKLKLSPREKTMIQYGGLLNAIKELGGDF